MKSVVALATMPVGSNVVPAELAGKCTMSGLPAGCGTPLPSYSVEVSVWLLAIHTGAPDAKTIPQGFTRLVSTVAYPLALSATRSFDTKVVAAVTVRVTDIMALVLPLYGPIA